MAALHLVVSVDFGFERSGASFVEKRESSNPTEIRVWPGADGEHFKFPSVVQYLKDGSKRFGFMVRGAPDSTTRAHFKIPLMAVGDDSGPKHKDLKDFANRSGSDLSWEDARCVLVDHFKFLHDHIQNQLKDHFSEEIIRDARIEYIITHPVLMSDAAKEMMKDIIGEAGFQISDVSLLDEALAASCALRPPLDSMGRVAFILADAGGCTIDVTTYTHLLEPVCPSDGSACGISLVDLEFRDMIREELPWLKDEPDIERDIMSEFGKAKAIFEGTEKAVSIYFRPPSDVEKTKHFDPNAKTICLKRAEMIKFFKSTEESLRNLVGKQHEEAMKLGYTVSRLVFTGGASANPYLKRKWNQFLPGVQKTWSVNAYTAVANGAAIYATMNKKPSFKLRYALGYIARVDFDKKVHPADKKVTSWDGTRRDVCEDATVFLFDRNRVITPGDEIDESVFYPGVTPEFMKVDLVIVGASEKVGVYRKDDERIWKIGVMEIDLEKEKLPRRKGPGSKKIFDPVIIIKAKWTARGIFKMTAYHGKTLVGKLLVNTKDTEAGGDKGKGQQKNDVDGDHLEKNNHGDDDEEDKSDVDSDSRDKSGRGGEENVAKDDVEGGGEGGQSEVEVVVVNEQDKNGGGSGDQSGHGDESNGANDDDEDENGGRSDVVVVKEGKHAKRIQKKYGKEDDQNNNKYVSIRGSKRRDHSPKALPPSKRTKPTQESLEADIAKSKAAITKMEKEVAESEEALSLLMPRSGK